jgi:hypothetical protein
MLRAGNRWKLDDLRVRFLLCEPGAGAFRHIFEPFAAFINDAFCAGSNIANSLSGAGSELIDRLSGAGSEFINRLTGAHAQFAGGLFRSGFQFNPAIPDHFARFFAALWREQKRNGCARQAANQKTDQEST